MPSKRSIMSVWYGTSKSGTTGSPYFSFSTLQESSGPIGTDASMMFGIIIISSFTLALYSRSSSSSSARRAALAVTCSLTLLASSFLPSFMRAPISFDSLLRDARRSSASCWVARAFLSYSITSSTNGSLCSWNFFLMFSLTTSGFSRKNLISIITSS